MDACARLGRSYEFNPCRMPPFCRPREARLGFWRYKDDYLLYFRPVVAYDGPDQRLRDFFSRGAVQRYAGFDALAGSLRALDGEAAALRPDADLYSRLTQELGARVLGQRPAVEAAAFKLRCHVCKREPLRPLSLIFYSCRQVTWKRVDLAIKACQITGSPLKVIGDGPEHQALVRLASNSPNIEFVPWLDATTLAHLLQNAKAYLFPSLEPFGIAAVEALAAGCPVIAYHAGGSRDFIQEGKNGTFFAEQTPESLAAALRHFETLHFNRTNVAKSVQEFSSDHFCRQIRHLVAESTASHHKKESHS